MFSSNFYYCYDKQIVNILQGNGTLINCDFIRDLAPLRYLFIYIVLPSIFSTFFVSLLLYIFLYIFEYRALLKVSFKKVAGIYELFIKSSYNHKHFVLLLCYNSHFTEKLKSLFGNLKNEI